jgi:proline iminopeptidase
LYFRVVGAGSDTVVMVHGGPGAGINSILPAVEPLADDFVLVFYDQRGGGRSTLPADTALLHADYFVADLEAVRRHFRLDRLKIFAHSFGSVLVASYAKRHPERVERMVFHGATGPQRARAARIARAAAPSPDTALSNRATGLLRTLLDGTASDPVATCREYEAIGRRLSALRGEPTTWTGSTCEAPAEAVRYYYRHTAQYAPRTFGDWDFTSGLERVSAPLLVVYGQRDSLALPVQRAWAAAVPHGRLLRVPGAGKAAITDRPDLVISAVTTFFGGDWPARARPVDGESAP